MKMFLKTITFSQNYTWLHEYKSGVTSYASLGLFWVYIQRRTEQNVSHNTEMSIKYSTLVAVLFTCAM